MKTCVVLGKIDPDLASLKERLHLELMNHVRLKIEMDRLAGKECTCTIVVKTCIHIFFEVV